MQKQNKTSSVYNSYMHVLFLKLKRGTWTQPNHHFVRRCNIRPLPTNDWFCEIFSLNKGNGQKNTWKKKLAYTHDDTNVSTSARLVLKDTKKEVNVFIHREWKTQRERERDKKKPLLSKESKNIIIVLHFSPKLVIIKERKSGLLWHCP